jgi:integrase
MALKRLTEAVVATAKVEDGQERTIYWDTGRGSVAGLGLQVTASGHKSFVFQYRRDGNSRRMKLNGSFLHHERERERKNGGLQIEPVATGRSTLAAAKMEAEAVKGAIARGRDPHAELKGAASRGEDTFQSIAESYLARPEAKNLRTAEVRAQILKRLVYPGLGDRPIDEIKRSDIHRLLDRIEDRNGPVMADRVFAILGRILNWHASRSDEFRSPIVRGMRASHAKERSRILTDDELRAVWRAAEAHPGPYGALVRFLLLTAARRSEASRLTWDEVVGAAWVLPPDRNKVMHNSRAPTDLVRPLSPMALAVIEKLPRIGKRGFVFTTNGQTPIGGFAKFKAQLDALVLQELRKADPEAKPLPCWTLHDLRRTARSLMSRAGVSSDHAERCLGHVIGGVEGIYDRHKYQEEMRLAYEKLAGLIERIVHPVDNVLTLRGRE